MLLFVGGTVSVLGAGGTGEGERRDVNDCGDDDTGNDGRRHLPADDQSPHQRRTGRGRGTGGASEWSLKMTSPGGLRSASAVSRTARLRGRSTWSFEAAKRDDPAQQWPTISAMSSIF